MKHNTAVFFRFLAVLAVIFLGITAVLPQSTVRENEQIIPVWNDVDTETDTDIITLYKKGIITGGVNGEYGINEPFTAKEAAFAAVAVYETDNGKKRSFNNYHPDKGEDYIKKAKEYKLWKKTLPKSDEALTREEAAAIIAPLVKADEVINNADLLPNEEKYRCRDEVLAVYNRGIMLDSSVGTSFNYDTVLTRGDAADLFMMCIERDRRREVKLPDYASLEIELKEQMSPWQGDWSLYFEDCTTGNKISINSHQVYSASLIKLFVAQTAYQKVAEGSMSETSKMNDEIRKMLTYSDNEAWQYLARLLGGGSYSRGMMQTTNIAQASGFSDTGQFYKGSHKNYNFTSVNDCGAFMKGLLDGTIVNSQYSDKILSLLKQQQHTQKIPAGIPDSVTVANKTGELEYMQGDSAIVYAPNGTYILCIIGDSLENGYGQAGRFADLSRTVYEFLN